MDNSGLPTEPFAGAGELEQARRLHRMAVDSAAAANPAEATRLLRRALRTLPPPEPASATELVVVRIKVLVTLALAQGETGSSHDGVGHLDEATRLASGLPDPGQRDGLYGLIHQQHAIIELRGGHTEAAIGLLDRAVPLLERSGDPVVLARTVMNRGLAHLTAGRPEPAEADLRRCVELAHDRLPLIEAKARHNLGDLAQLIGDIPAALRHYQRAAEAYATLAPAMLGRLGLDQARAMLAAGLAEEAARSIDEVLPGLRSRHVGQDLAEAEVTRAAAALMDGDVQAARRYAMSARRRFIRRRNEPWALLASLTKMRADAFDALFPWHERRHPGQDGKRGRVTPAGAVELAGRLAAHELTDEAALARMLAVRLALRRQSPRSVAEAHRLMADVQAPRRTSPIDNRMLYRLCLAELALAQDNTRAALAQARQGLAELSRVRDRMGGLDLLCGTAIHGWELGRLAMRQVIDAARTPADARRVLLWQERTRAQVYRYDPLPRVGDPTQASQFTELRTLMRATQQARLSGRPAAQLEQRCAALRRNINRLGWATTPWGRPRPVSTPNLVAGQLGDRVLVSFASPGDRIDAVVVRDGRTTLVQLAQRSQVMAAARELHADLDALAPDHLLPVLAASVTGSARTRAERLDALLMGPLRNVLDDREVVLVPFASLFSVPWSALPSLRGRAVSVAPSATAWVTADNLPRATDGKVVLVSGPGLPDAVAELSVLQEVYPHALVLDGPRATAAAVLDAMDGADLVHVAAHGMHEADNALFSRLELADGGLLAHEVARLPRPPRHVVLAACELALSNVRPGDEVLGFAGAMLAAGSRTVVAAVSRVGDRAAADTMTDYHRNLIGSASSDTMHTMADLHRRLAAGVRPARALAEVTAADPLRRPFICLGAG